MGPTVILLSPVELGAESFLLSIYPSSDCQNREQEACLEAPGDDVSADVDSMQPPLGVKLMGYRLVFMATVFSFGPVKAILTYMGQSIAPTTLDWVSGTLLTVV